MNAFVLIEARAGKVKSILDGIKKLTGVKAVHAVIGPYDIIAYVEAGDLKALGDLVVGKIHAIDGVERTLTSIAVDL